MLRLITLLLPVLIPSWRFFKTIAPSPRIETRVQSDAWIEDRPLPANVGVGLMLWRLVWNPDWNQRLYLLSCAERLVSTDDPQAAREIWRCLPPETAQFRLVFHAREGPDIVTAVLYESEARASP